MKALIIILLVSITIPGVSQINEQAVIKRIYKAYKKDMKTEGYSLSQHDKDSLYIKAIDRVAFAVDSLKTLYATFNWPHLTNCSHNHSTPLPQPHYFNIPPKPTIMYRQFYPFDRIIIR